MTSEGQGRRHLTICRPSSTQNAEQHRGGNESKYKLGSEGWELTKVLIPYRGVAAGPLRIFPKTLKNSAIKFQRTKKQYADSSLFFRHEIKHDPPL